jgi:hypothetical protein
LSSVPASASEEGTGGSAALRGVAPLVLGLPVLSFLARLVGVVVSPAALRARLLGVDKAPEPFAGVVPIFLAGVDLLCCVC